MTLEEFSATVVRNEQPEFIELDLRPFGLLQRDALEFWLDLAIKQGDLFGKKIAIKTGAPVILFRACASVPREVTRARRFIFRDRRAIKLLHFP
jgi:hypothetical protein